MKNKKLVELLLKNDPEIEILILDRTEPDIVYEVFGINIVRLDGKPACAVSPIYDSALMIDFEDEDEEEEDEWE